MGRSERIALVGAPLVCAACTLTGLGSYATATCPAQVGTTTVPTGASGLAPLGVPAISALNGATPIGAFLESSECVQAINAGGPVLASGGGCLFPSSSSLALAPQQPFVVPIGDGFASVAIAAVATNGSTSSTPCTQGDLTLSTVSSGGTVSASPSQAGCSAAGAALPSAIPTTSGASALVTWYATPLSTRADSIQSCATATAAPLMIVQFDGANSQTPAMSTGTTPVTLTQQSISVRAAAMTQLVGTSQQLVAAPDGNAVSVWALSSAQAVSPVPVAGLAGARAVSIASATDGSGRIAVVAEIGCSPQSIALALGTLSGFTETTTVAAASGAFAVQPTVAWVAPQPQQPGYWLVSWISGTGGAHVLAARFDANGNAVGGVIDPSVPALVATALSDGTLFAYALPKTGSGAFETVQLGCAQ